MANLGFSTTASSQKVSASDYNIERPPKIAIWPPKPDIVMYTTGATTETDSVKIPTASMDFRPWRARKKCRQVIATMCDNWKWQCGYQNPMKYLHMWNYMTDRMTIQMAQVGVPVFKQQR